MKYSFFADYVSLNVACDCASEIKIIEDYACDYGYKKPCNRFKKKVMMPGIFILTFEINPNT